jgi:hypothetical protein
VSCLLYLIDTNCLQVREELPYKKVPRDLPPDEIVIPLVKNTVGEGNPLEALNS